MPPRERRQATRPARPYKGVLVSFLHLRSNSVPSSGPSLSLGGCVHRGDREPAKRLDGREDHDGIEGCDSARTRKAATATPVPMAIAEAMLMEEDGLGWDWCWLEGEGGGGGADDGLECSEARLVTCS